MSIDEGMDKEDIVCVYLYLYLYRYRYRYTHTYIYSAIKKNEIMPFAVIQMHLEIIILTEVSKKEKDKYHMISLMCGI